MDIRGSTHPYLPCRGRRAETGARQRRHGCGPRPQLTCCLAVRARDMARRACLASAQPGLSAEGPRRPSAPLRRPPGLLRQQAAERRHGTASRSEPPWQRGAVRLSGRARRIVRVRGRLERHIVRGGGTQPDRRDHADRGNNRPAEGRRGDATQRDDPRVPCACRVHVQSGRGDRQSRRCSPHSLRRHAEHPCLGTWRNRGHAGARGSDSHPAGHRDLRRDRDLPAAHGDLPAPGAGRRVAVRPLVSGICSTERLPCRRRNSSRRWPPSGR